MPETLRCDPKLFDKDLTGQVVIVTGAYAGIGFVTATQLLKQKATVIMAGRDVEKGTKVAADAGGVFMKLDLTSLDSVRDFARAFLAAYDRLDILVCNAGIMMPAALSHTKDGFELQMGTNHFGHFLLCEQLRGVLEKSAPSRVVLLSSCASAKCDPAMGSECVVDFTDLHWQSRKYDKGEAYAQSKLANVLHAMELSKRYKGVTAYSLHPGWVQSELMRHMAPACCMPCIGFCAMKVAGAMIATWEGTQTSLHCILSEPAALENGAFYSQFGIYADPDSKAGGWPLKHPNPEVTEENARRLWEESVALVSSGVAGTEGADGVQTPLMTGMCCSPGKK